ncbi:MmgE/PrpD family protein [Micromonospora zamorensis]|uniref:MmgE/PrpD family protein n=1 Tax=Micromonospora zamorensis TaxID=709883 RepID=UPI0008201D11|nr:MmgE/PrpD family protein [Micromonospora zamorensis]WSK49678.1 MmgE/PrpD family protein [Micromonospora zamorensis]WTE87654.1 MmgE/PrpD family protein [Micromonospora zamorensis]SCG56835.1 2-methylcitrate dehydratase PrpD [Micromonospora zamorensis]
MMQGIDTKRIAAFAHDTSLGDPPEEVLTFTRALLLDTLGAMLGGLRYPAVRALAESLRPSATTDLPFGRLLTLGTAATWLDADSGGSFHPQGHRLPPVPTAHPAPHSLPVLLHAAAHGVDDRRLVEIFLIANEIGMRFGVGTTLRPGLHPHGIHGPIAAAVATALLDGLPPATTATAIELAGAVPMAATLAVPMRGGTVRNLWTGLGAYYGASAARRAADGATGSEALLRELLDGLVCTDLSAAELTTGLGTRWRLTDSYLKPYACARWVHPALDAFRAAVAGVADPVRERGGLAAIEVDTFAFAASLSTVDVSSDLQARFSVPVSLATLALDGELAAAGFLPDRLARPEVGALAALVRLREEPVFTAALPHERPTRVTVHWRDGSTASATVRNARGNPDDPLTADEVAAKFRRNVEDVLDPTTADAVVAGLLDGAGGDTMARAAAEVIGRFCP